MTDYVKIINAITARPEGLNLTDRQLATSVDALRQVIGNKTEASLARHFAQMALDAAEGRDASATPPWIYASFLWNFNKAVRIIAEEEKRGG